MSDNKYNGWANYATWRVNLEFFDGEDEKWKNCNPNSLREFVEETIEEGAPEGIARDYALAFIDDVYWYEIAKHFESEDDDDARQTT